MESKELDDDEIRHLLKRLARRNAAGADVIDRAAILAEGVDSSAVLAWIEAHGGVAEVNAPAAPGGLHGGRLSTSDTATRATRRYVLPAGVLSPAPN